MKYFLHTLYTWLLAQALLPFILIVYFVFIKKGEVGINGFYYFIFIFVSFFASIPSLLIAWLSLSILSKVNLFTGEKFLAWIFLVLSSVFLNYAGLKLMLGEDIGSDILNILIPVSIAAVLSILIRLKYFFLLNQIINQLNNGNNLV